MHKKNLLGLALVCVGVGLGSPTTHADGPTHYQKGGYYPKAKTRKAQPQTRWVRGRIVRKTVSESNPFTKGGYRMVERWYLQQGRRMTRLKGRLVFRGHHNKMVWIRARYIPTRVYRTTPNPQLQRQIIPGGGTVAQVRAAYYIVYAILPRRRVRRPRPVRRPDHRRNRRNPLVHPSSARSRRCGMTTREARVFHRVNWVRHRAGKRRLSCSARLVQAARRWSQQQCRMRRLSHARMSSRIRRALGRSPRFMSENVASGSRTAKGVMRQWLHSRGHRNNILSGRGTIMGVGYVHCQGQPYWTQIFARP